MRAWLIARPGSTRSATRGRSVLPQLPAMPTGGSEARISGRVLTPAMPSFIRPPSVSGLAEVVAVAEPERELAAVLGRAKVDLVERYARSVQVALALHHRQPPDRAVERDRIC